MGGKFYVNDAGRPCFLQSGSQIEEEIKTGIIPGMKLVVDSNPKELVPGVYTYIGTISDRNVKFNKIISYTQDHVETYAGEFSLGYGGSITFPTTIRWDKYSWDMFRWGQEEGLSPDPNVSFRYLIQNGLGKLEAFMSAELMYKNPTEWDGTLRARDNSEPEVS